VRPFAFLVFDGVELSADRRGRAAEAETAPPGTGEVGSQVETGRSITDPRTTGAGSPG
jgi:hypothetical protein